ncbi:thiol reductant ABC exporter subunit CydD [Rhodosalinus sediminis]|uniref:thiol reductant ABC exporter subunit CydD n=1 Tax=Rhodosalinus sediminis TaxID=1940533 RepID=UPI002352FD9B|nr:thiol reductant ABC exporter subunit CydD [Rhodosalinus sediminis]
MADGDRLQRLEARAGAPLRAGGWLLAVAGALWLVQAFAAAQAVAAWIGGAGGAGLGWAAGFVGAGLLRAGLEHAGGGLVHRAADRAVAAERAALLEREARRPEGGPASAEVAALATQKLAALTPYLTRYKPAMLRVRLIPPLILAASLSVSWAVALVLLVAGPLIPVFMALVGMAAREASEKQMAEIGDMNALLIDRIAALPDIRLLDATARAEADFAARAEGLRARTMAVLRVAFLSSTILELFSALGVALVAVYVGFTLLGEIGIGHWGDLTLAGGLFVLLLAPEFFQPLRDMAAAWHDRAAARAVAGELAALEDDPRPAILGRGEAVAPLDGPATLRLEGAAVARGGAPVALPDLAVAPGEAVALTGPSGAGKSSALMAAAGLLPVEAGRIEVAGRTLDAATADAWRARVALVPQAVHVPDVTLRAFLDPAGQGGDPAPALAAAGAEGVVARLPEGLDTRLGETGAGVSGGEARRLLVARAILSGADVVLADEPTADLDTDTARQVIAGLQALAARGATLLVATHDPRLIAAMDRVVEMPGRAAEGAA